jgi:tetratricopeptide (TPR) repeat protein
MPVSAATDEYLDMVEDAQADPAGFQRRVPVLLRRHADDEFASAHVRWARGIALRELGELPNARRELEHAASLADAAGAPRTSATIRSSLATVLLSLGHTELALLQTERATAALDGADAARNAMQRGVILQRLGRHEDAARAYDGAHHLLQETGDRAAESRLLSNRGVLRAYRGDLDGAQADLERSVELARHIGASRGVALGLQNLGFVAGRRGDLPVALSHLEEADALLRELDDVAALAVLDADRAEVLADAGLLDEAIERAEAAAASLTHDHMNGPEAELLIARLCLMAGHLERAGDLAARVRARFRDAGRIGWELHARYVALAATAPSIDVGPAIALADDLEVGGWATEARITRLLAARQAQRDGRHALARQLLDRVRDASRTAPALARAQHWYATALVRLDDGDRAGARRAITSGLGLLDRSRLVFASAELRAHAVGHTVDLVRLAIRLALEDGRPAEALRALDRVRATEVGVRRLPPDDPELAHDLADLRRLEQEERDAAHAGEEPAVTANERARLERRIRDRARALAPGQGETASLRLNVAELRRRLAGRTLIAYLQMDERIHAIIVEPRRTRHRELASVDEVQTAVDHLRAAVRRLARGLGSPASLAATQAALGRSAEELAGLLGLDRMDPVGAVVVPTRAVAGVPWGALVPVLGALPTLAPSAAAWMAATEGAGSQGHDGGSTLLVAGPDLPGADEEVAALAEQLPDAQVLRGADATVAAVVEAMAQADTVHVAAHGAFRGDNPMFSSLWLHDGSLTVYELERLRRVPRSLVLSSCEAAATSALRGDVVLGLSSVLLTLGVRCLIAPVLEVPDAAAGGLMVGLHRRIAAGEPPQLALADEVRAGSPTGAAAAAVRVAFQVFGDGGGPAVGSQR